MGLLEGKCALVTGGTTGLGLAIAGRFRREGAQVVITGRDRDLRERAEQALGPGARFVAADAADPDAVASSVGAAADHLGGLDVLVNNAGVGVAARLIDTPIADYDRVMNVNVRGYLLYAQHAYPYLARSRGCMIHIASDAGIWGEQATGLYSVTRVRSGQVGAYPLATVGYLAANSKGQTFVVVTMLSDPAAALPPSTPTGLLAIIRGAFELVQNG